jgi:hypothetical protein
LFTVQVERQTPAGGVVQQQVSRPAVELAGDEGMVSHGVVE